MKVSASSIKALNQCSAGPCMATCIIGDRSGVYDGMHIYLITNLVNGKQYVGRTERRDANRRWTEHRSAAQRKATRDNSPLHNAMRKYGLDLFSFEIIETVTERDLLPTRESHWINHHGCLTPKGYNLEVYQANRRLSTPESTARMSRSLQGVKRGKTSQFRGVTRSGDGFVVEIRKAGRGRFARWFKSEQEAASMYDRLALYLYGPKAQVNMSESRKHTVAELQGTYDLFNKPRETSSQYIGVHWCATTNRWKAATGVGNGDYGRRSFIDEVSAAEIYDKSRLHLFGHDFKGQLNFPLKREAYLKEDLSVLFVKKPVLRPAPNIRHRSGPKGYRARLRFGRWTLLTEGLSTLEEAQDELTKMKVVLSIS